MKVFIALCAIVAVASAQLQPEDESPKPYSFNYVAEGEEGTSSHQETADGTGAVRGSYSLSDADGRNRVVEYVADAAGFRANIRTNEPGTDNAAPADVTVESSAESAALFSAPLKPEVPAPAPRQQENVRYVLVPAN